MKPLSNKIVLLTGASRGLGVDMAKHFAAKGARLALAARSEADLERVAASLPGETIVVPADVADLAALERLVKTVEGSLGAVDVLVNNAGIEHVGDFETMDVSLMERIVATNVTGLMWLTRLVLPSMISRGTGHIVNIASLAGLNPVPHNTVYSASKHAVVGFSRSLRAEMADHGIGVSVVCPGFVDGGMFAQWGRKPPRGLAAVSTEQVAEAVVAAVERNEGIVPVGKGLARIGHWVGAIAPEFARKTAERTGFTEFMREQARINAER